MSKAFVKESDAEPDLPDDGDAPPLPSGVKNYVTPEGHRQMQEELRRLLREDRPKTVEVLSWAAGNGDRSENGDYLYGKKRLREIDRRIRFLSKRRHRRGGSRPPPGQLDFPDRARPVKGAAGRCCRVAYPLRPGTDRGDRNPLRR